MSQEKTNTKTADITAIDLEKLLHDANAASQTVSAVHLTFIAFIAYFFIIIWGITHEDILRVNPVNLPIFNVQVPLTTFFGGVPWLLVLLHFNLLLELELLSRKLWNFDKAVPEDEAGQTFRDQLFIYPFAHFIAGRSNVGITRVLLALSVRITIIALPPLILLAAQICFLPYHDEAITWSQRLAVWVDILLITALWPLIVSRNDNWLDWLANSKYWLKYLQQRYYDPLKQWLTGKKQLAQKQNTPLQNHDSSTKSDVIGIIFFFIIFFIVLVTSVIALIPGEMTAAAYYQAKNAKQPTSFFQYLASTFGFSGQNSSYHSPYFEDYLVFNAPKTLLVALQKNEKFSKGGKVAQFDCVAIPDEADENTVNNDNRIMLSPTCKLFEIGSFQRNLNLEEARLVSKEAPLSLLSKATSANLKERLDALVELPSLSLLGRDLRFANLQNAFLPNTDLRLSLLQNVNLYGAKMQGVNLYSANLQGANLGKAELQNADLNDATLINIVLYHANLQNCRMYGAKVSNGNLYEANMQGALLYDAKLEGANLTKTNMQGAILNGAVINGAIVDNTVMQATDLSRADFRGAHFSQVNLQAAYLVDTKLPLETIDQASLDYAYLKNSAEQELTANEKNKLLSILKPIMNDNEFNKLTMRLDKSNQKMAVGTINPKHCWSNTSPVQCAFSTDRQLNDYQEKLNNFLLELPCGPAEIAAIVPKITEDTGFNQQFTTAFIAGLEAKSTCVDLNKLPENVKQKLVSKIKN